MKYATHRFPEWIQPVQRGYKMMCCDCGLVHTLNFRVIVRVGKKEWKVLTTREFGLDTKVQFQCSRNNRSTAQARRFQGITVKKGKK